MATGKPEFIRMSRTQAWVTIALGVVIAFTAAASFSLVNLAKAHPPTDGSSVRVSALKGEDGRVSVGVQVLGADGQWGKRLLPDRRVISTSSRTNTWLRSSPVMIDAGGSELTPLFCVVAHGAAEDPFWVKFRAFLYQSASSSDSNLRFETHLRGDDQAAAIDRCIADGAAVIASTLASPEDVREPLKQAKAAGIRVVTFNAGVEHAEALGSEIHIALNDRAAGELAGRHFNERGFTGQVGCVIHEENNLSLEHRCDGLEEVFQGAGVTRIRLEEDASQHGHDHENLTETLANVFRDEHGPDYGAILTLNADILDHALTAVQQLGAAAEGLQIGSVGVNLADLAAFPADFLDQHLNLLISDSADAQGHFVAGALLFSYKLHSAAYISQP